MRQPPEKEAHGRADVGEPRLDLGSTEPVGRFGLPHQSRALGVGGEHDFDQRLRPAGSLLGDGADAHLPRQRDAAAFGGDLALDQSKEGGLPGAVPPDEPDAGTSGQREAGLIEQNAPSDPEGEVIDVQHAALWRDGFRVASDKRRAESRVQTGSRRRTGHSHGKARQPRLSP
jgi:hypothetical protein